MGETINKMFANLREYFSKMTPANRRKLLILTIAIVVLSIVVVAVLSRTKWVILPGTASSIDPSAITTTLAEAGIQTKQEGINILVPEQDRQRATEHLREQGLITSSTFNDDYLSAAAGFGVSSAQAKEYYDYQTADNIRTMLLQNPRVQNAHVIVNSGETSPFRIQTNTRAATATVQVTLNDGGMLSQAEAQSIAEMVKGAVPGIEYENISILDNRLNTYSATDGAQSLESQLAMRLEYQNLLTEQHKTQIENLLSPTFGIVNLRVQPYIELNFDNTAINRVEWEPPIPGETEGIVRSSERIWERSRQWADAMGIPGTDENGLGTGEYPYGDFGDGDIYMRNVEGLNFEINETRTAIEVAQGKIERFSISVLINSAYAGEDVEPPDFTEEVRELVAMSAGISPALISIQYLPFQDLSEAYQELLDAQREAENRAFRNWLIEQILKYGTIILLIVLVFLLGKSIFKGLQPQPEPELVPADGPLGVDVLIDETADRGYDDVDFNSKSAGLEQIERFIDKDPASVTQLLRNWLSEE